MERRSINLGRCHNKYIIIEILLLAAENDGQREAEALLWVCSPRHRCFMGTNFDWYPRNIEWKEIWRSLMKDSREESVKKAKFLLEKIRKRAQMKVTKATQIFSASQYGWKYADEFRKHCWEKAKTLTLLWSNDDCLAAIFCPWTWK